MNQLLAHHNANIKHLFTFSYFVILF